MPDDFPGNNLPNDEDAEFKQWASRDKGEDEPPPNVPASVTFMEMMRQAAAKASGEVPEASVSEAPAPFAANSSRAEAPARAAKPVSSAPAPSVRRVRRNKSKTKRTRTTVSLIGGLFRAFLIVIVAAGLMATIFTWWTPNEFISTSVRQDLSAAIATNAATDVPTVAPTPNWARKIGIVSGHRGNNSGAVCPDGLTEASVNLSVAQLVVQDLRAVGYTVDLLDEFDPRLNNYQAAALVSIHSNTCQNFGQTTTGFIIASSASRISSHVDDSRLVECIAQHYAATTHLTRRTETTVDMTDYHSFREIHPLTPAAIIELGFLLADREILTSHPDTLARGISDGVLCYLEPGTG